ncbi:unnamed protein product [Amoebophrya sp. A25]|nr:unnamed protein product [Amoebophrya sp. A25]|eukprot:GSA25T00003270001.1
MLFPINTLLYESARVASLSSTEDINTRKKKMMVPVCFKVWATGAGATLMMTRMMDGVTGVVGVNLRSFQTPARVPQEVSALPRLEQSQSRVEEELERDMKLAKDEMAKDNGEVGVLQLVDVEEPDLQSTISAGAYERLNDLAREDVVRELELAGGGDSNFCGIAANGVFIAAEKLLAASSTPSRLQRLVSLSSTSTTSSPLQLVYNLYQEMKEEIGITAARSRKTEILPSSSRKKYIVLQIKEDHHHAHQGEIALHSEKTALQNDFPRPPKFTGFDTFADSLLDPRHPHFEREIFMEYVIAGHFFVVVLYKGSVAVITCTSAPETTEQVSDDAELLGRLSNKRPSTVERWSWSHILATSASTLSLSRSTTSRSTTTAKVWPSSSVLPMIMDLTRENVRKVWEFFVTLERDTGLWKAAFGAAGIDYEASSYRDVQLPWSRSQERIEVVPKTSFSLDKTMLERKWKTKTNSKNINEGGQGEGQGQGMEDGTGSGGHSTSTDEALARGEDYNNVDGDDQTESSLIYLRELLAELGGALGAEAQRDSFSFTTSRRIMTWARTRNCRGLRDRYSAVRDGFLTKMNNLCSGRISSSTLGGARAAPRNTKVDDPAAPRGPQVEAPCFEDFAAVLLQPWSTKDTSPGSTEGHFLLLRGSVFGHSFVIVVHDGLLLLVNSYIFVFSLYEWLGPPRCGSVEGKNKNEEPAQVDGERRTKMVENGKILRRAIVEEKLNYPVEVTIENIRKVWDFIKELGKVNLPRSGRDLLQIGHEIVVLPAGYKQFRVVDDVASCVCK